MPDDTALLDNHLAFLASHRGVLTRTDQAIELVGRADFRGRHQPGVQRAGAGDGTAFTSAYYRKA